MLHSHENPFHLHFTVLIPNDECTARDDFLYGHAKMKESTFSIDILLA